MYCPKCGQQQVSEEVRFCSRCGFTLASVRASLAVEGETPATPAAAPHRDINSGVALMLVGTLFTSAVVAVGSGVGPAAAFAVLTITFISVLLASRQLMQAIRRLLSWEETPAGAGVAARRGMGFGALLMYVGTILSACAATLVPGRWGATAFFVALLPVFALLLLCSQHLTRAVQDFLTDESAQPQGLPPARVVTASLPQVGALAEAAALPPPRGTPAMILGAQHLGAAEMAAPPSVTERTTNLIGDK